MQFLRITFKRFRLQRVTLLRLHLFIVGVHLMDEDVMTALSPNSTDQRIYLKITQHQAGGGIEGLKPA